MHVLGSNHLHAMDGIGWDVHRIAGAHHVGLAPDGPFDLPGKDDKSFRVLLVEVGGYGKLRSPVRLEHALAARALISSDENVDIADVVLVDGRNLAGEREVPGLARLLGAGKTYSERHDSDAYHS